MRATDPSGQSIRYEYDELKRLTRSETEQDGKLYLNEYTYENNRPKTVSHNTTGDTPDVTYSFEYDAFGSPAETYVGDQLLSQNIYSDGKDHRLKSVVYGNGAEVHYEYDAFKRVTGIRRNDETEPSIEYFYGDNGQVNKLFDRDLNRMEEDEYDSAGQFAVYSENTRAAIVKRDLSTNQGFLPETLITSPKTMWSQNAKNR
jgi:YD repeat-containing protein